jgi:ArsR family transcriptional regulator
MLAYMAKAPYSESRVKARAGRRRTGRDAETMRDGDSTTARSVRYRRVALLMGALANESRLIIIDKLSTGECCLCELAELTELDQSTVSRHMSKLERSGVIARERRGQHVYFCLRAPWVKDLLDSLLLDRDGGEGALGRQV